MTAGPTGKVVTFYSFKGGTGRTMALANVAWILAANGKRVLTVDWDLESPGLHRYFAPFVAQKAIGESPGVIGLIQEFQNAKMRQFDGYEEPNVGESTDLTGRIIGLKWGFPEGGRLDLLPAGRLNLDYAKNLAGVDWDDFYERQDGKRFFRALRDTMKRQYDYTLIDSRTGYSDVADICTIELPDVLVDCFTLNEQGIDGSAAVAQQILRHKPEMRILPVPMRLDPAEKKKADAGLNVAQQRFAGLPALATEVERDSYWSRVQVPYQAYYGYEEVLATFGDDPERPGTLLAAYEVLAGELTEGEVIRLPQMDSLTRSSVTDQFERRIVVAETDIALRYSDRDVVWAEWLGHVLTAAGVRVVDPVVDSTADTSGCRDLSIISSAADASPAPQLTPLGAPRSPLGVFVADIKEIDRIRLSKSVRIDNLTESAAVEKVLELVGHAENGSVPPIGQGSPRFPGDEPVVTNIGAPNTRFTGREEELRTLRRQLGSGGAIVLSAANPVTLQGMGGVGKTAIALEYARRFRSTYDVIWLVNAEKVTFIDTQLDELGRALGLPLGPVAPENARAVLDALKRGEPHKRWLVIFDNAEDPTRVGPFLPSGPGHVLITSRNPAWADQARALPVDVFERRESLDHFLSRVPSMASAEANRLAGLLGDLPIAVASAAAFLAETGFPVAELVREIEQRGPGMIPTPGPTGVERTPDQEAQAQSVQVVWDVSLSRLRDRSVAGYRLLQLCSLMDTTVSSEIIYGEEMAQELTPYDPSLTVRLLRGRMVQEISRLALARVEQRSQRAGGDPEADSITMHRLVQWAVRSQMSPEDLAEARHQVHLVLARSRPGGEVEDPETWRRFGLLWPHLERSGAVECGDPSVRQLVIDRVRYLWVTGDYNRGVERARQTEKVWVERLAASGNENQMLRGQLLHLRFNMANLLRSLGDLEKARNLDEQVLAEQQQLLGADHPLTLVTAGSLAADLRALGHYRQALEHDQVTYDAWREIFGDLHPRTLASRNNLATSYRLMGDYKTALALDEQVYEGREIVHGKNHPYTLHSFGQVGRDLREGGEYQQSVDWLRDAVGRYDQESESGARDTLNAAVNLAISLRSAGHLDEASQLFDQAYDRLSDKFPLAPDTLNCRLSRSITMLGIGSEFAASELRAVYDAYRSRVGDKHPQTLVCLNNMAMGLLDDDPQQARDLAREVAADFAEAVGADHPYTLAAEANLGVSLARCGSYEPALEILRSVAARSAGTLDPNHPDTLCCVANIALVEAQAGSGGASNVAAAGERLAARVGATHPAVLAVGRHRFVQRVIDPLPF